MTYKQIQKLMGLIQYAPEEEQNELAGLLAKVASTKTVQRSITDNQLTENGTVTFTKKEINSMPDDIKRLFIVGQYIVRYRYYKGLYQARFRRDGFTIEVASKDFNKMKEKFLLALMEQTTNKPSKKPLMKDFLKQWLAEKKLTVKESTYKSYVDMIQYNVLPAFANKHIDQITRKDIQDFLFGLVEQGKNRTAQKIKQLLGAIFSLAVEDYDFKNPMTKVTLPHYEAKKGSPLTRDEEKRLIEICAKTPKEPISSALLILLYTGMRIGELPSMELKNDGKNTYIECITGKTRQGYATVKRKIPISPMLKKVWNLIDFDKAKNTNRDSTYRTFKSYFPNRHTHELRYTFISRCKECGCNFELVMLWDGHEFDKDVKSSKVDRGYTQYSDEIYFGDIEKVNYEL